MAKLFDYEPLPAVAGTGTEMNAAQRRAIEHGDGPLLVIAGAGTGKTGAITESLRRTRERNHAHYVSCVLRNDSKRGRASTRAAGNGGSLDFVAAEHAQAATG